MQLYGMLTRRATGWRRLSRLISIGFVLVLILITVPGRASAGASALVRVNQVGYVMGTGMRAYLMSAGPESGATFHVKNPAGATVYSSSIGMRLGSWNASYPYVYALDFKAAVAAGTYSISVNGPIDATSPPFKIDTAAKLYLGPLTNALYFYQAERDGPSYIRSALRAAPAHLNDQNAMTYLTPAVDSNGNFSGDLSPLGVRIDASGGWWDAGDYLKFVETTSYTVALQLMGVRDFPFQMGARSTAGNFGSEAKFGLDWLQRMWDDRTQTLYYQVGIGAGNANAISDHDISGGCRR